MEFVRSPHLQDQGLLLASDGGPTLLAAGRFWHRDRDFRTTYRSPTHAIHLYEYACRMRWCGREESILPGDLTLSPSTTDSQYHLPEDGRHWCIHFHPRPLGNEPFRVPIFLRLGPAADPTAERFAHISRLHEQGKAVGPGGRIAQHAASAAFQELLLELALRHLEAPRPQPARRSEQAAERVAALLAERFPEMLSIPQLCAEVGASQNHLAATFRRRYGVTMPRFLLQRRIDRAGFLLTTTDLPVGAVAAAVGLPDSHHFTKQFRRLTGRTPSAARLE